MSLFVSDIWAVSIFPIGLRMQFTLHTYKLRDVQTHVLSFCTCVCKEDSRLTQWNSYFNLSSEDTWSFQFPNSPIKISSFISTTTATKSQFKLNILSSYIFLILIMSFKNNVKWALSLGMRCCIILQAPDSRECKSPNVCVGMPRKKKYLYYSF